MAQMATVAKETKKKLYFMKYDKKMMKIINSRFWSLKKTEICWLIEDSMSSDEGSQSQEVCWSTEESLSPDKSSLSQEVFQLIMELMSSEKSSWSQEICGLIGRVNELW